MIQWLLIGGPAHGRTLWIKYGGRVICEDTPYQGENYLSNGRLYRVGRAPEVAFDQVADIERLISEKRLKEVA